MRLSRQARELLPEERRCRSHQVFVGLQLLGRGYLPRTRELTLDAIVGRIDVVASFP